MKKSIVLSLVLGVTLLANSTFRDKETGLLWQDNRDAITVKKDWYDAKEYCQNLTLAGSSNWRLPTRIELLSITDKKRYDPAIKRGFQYTNSDKYWSSSSTSYLVIFDIGWYVNFEYGSDGRYYKSNSYAVRCIQDSGTLKL